MPEINFFIEMQPVPKARARVTRTGHAYTPKRTLDAEKFIRIFAERFAPREKITGPIVLMLQFCMKQQKKNQSGLYHIKRPDLDNLTKTVMDALSDFWHDDAQVAELRCVKKYRNLPGVNVTIQYWE